MCPMAYKALLSVPVSPKSHVEPSLPQLHSSHTASVFFQQQQQLEDKQQGLSLEASFFLL